MTCNVTYQHGEPYIIWKCMCDYDSSKESCITSNNTNFEYILKNNDKSG